MPSRKKPQRKKKNTKATKRSWLEPINQFFKDRHPILKFTMAFFGCMLVFYLFYYSSLYKNYLEVPFLDLQANISNLILLVLGHDTTVANASISSANYSVNIRNGCDGLEAIAILISGILIFPTTMKLKMPGILWGGLTLLILNLFRIAGLYLIGLNFSPAVFEVMHVQGGFIIFTMISVILWFIWMNWAVKQPQQ